MTAAAYGCAWISAVPPTIRGAAPTEGESVVGSVADAGSTVADAGVKEARQRAIVSASTHSVRWSSH
jgi:hypothetical protein